MKICIYTENYHKGGLDSFLINLVNSWPNSTDIFTIVVNASHPGLEEIQSKILKKIQIIRYKSHYFELLTLLHKFNASKFLLFLLRFLYSFLKYPVIAPCKLIRLIIFFYFLNTNRLLVINGGYPASLNCRLSVIAWLISGKKYKAIMNFHSEAQKSSLHNALFDNILDFLVFLTTKSFIGVSGYCVKSLEKRFIFRFVSKSKFQYIYNGIADLNLPFKSKKTRREKYCLMLATYTPYKGHEYIFQAFKHVIKKHPEFMLRIYGYGSSAEVGQINKILLKSGISKNVKLYPFTNDVAHLIKRAAVLLLPSQSFEGFGLTIIESMCLGTPVVVTNIGGIPEVIANSGAGIICPYDNPKNFADAILYLIDNPKISSVMSKNGRLHYLKNFRSATMSHSYWKKIK